MENQAVANRLVELMEANQAGFAGMALQDILEALYLTKRQVPLVNESQTNLSPAVIESGCIGDTQIGEYIDFSLVLVETDTPKVKFNIQAHGPLQAMLTSPLDAKFLEELFWVLPASQQQMGSLKAWHEQIMAQANALPMLEY